MMNRQRRFRASIVLMALAVILQNVGVAGASPPDSISPQQLLRQLRQRDDLLMKQGVRLEGIYHEAVLFQFFAPGVPHRRCDAFVLTTDSTRIAWRNEFIAFDEQPYYVPPSPEEVKDLRMGDYDDEGYLLFRLVSRSVTVFETGRLNAVRVYLRIGSVSPTGTFSLSSGEGSIVRLCRWDRAPGCGTPFHQVEKSLLCTGRGFSYLLAKPLSVVRRADGLLELKATDGRGKAKHLAPILLLNMEADEGGYWVLVIDPSADYLVREARYYTSPSAVKPFFTLTTKGILRVKGGSIARSGRYVLCINRERPLMVYEFSYKDWKPRFDAGLYGELSQCIFDLPKGTPVDDFRIDEENGIRWYYGKEEQGEL